MDATGVGLCSGVVLLVLFWSPKLDLRNCGIPIPASQACGRRNCQAGRQRCHWTGSKTGAMTRARAGGPWGKPLQALRVAGESTSENQWRSHIYLDMFDKRRQKVQTSCDVRWHGHWCSDLSSVHPFIPLCIYHHLSIYQSNLVLFLFDLILCNRYVFKRWLGPGRLLAQARIKPRVVGLAPILGAAGDSWSYINAVALCHIVSHNMLEDLTHLFDQKVFICMILGLFFSGTCWVMLFTSFPLAHYAAIVSEWNHCVSLRLNQQAWHFCSRDFNTKCGKLQSKRLALKRRKRQPKRQPKRKRRQSHQRRWLALKSGTNSRPKPLCPGRCGWFDFFKCLQMSAWQWFGMDYRCFFSSGTCTRRLTWKMALNSCSTKDCTKCLARTWNGGQGGQCQEARPTDSVLCYKHQRRGFTGKLGSKLGVSYWCWYFMVFLS